MFIEENWKKEVTKGNQIMYNEINNIVPKIIEYEQEKIGIYDQLPEEEKEKFQKQKNMVLRFLTVRKIIVCTEKSDMLSDLIAFHSYQQKRLA